MPADDPAVPELPEPSDPAGEFPELPPGYVWALTITAEAVVIPGERVEEEHP